jgi:hypothetical protein
MSEHLKAWQCIGCGKIEAPQTCVGVWQDRKVEFVYAFEHEKALFQLQAAPRHANALGALVRRLAWTKPHEDEWEHSYQALQQDARRILVGIGSGSVGNLCSDGRTD